MMSAPWLSQVPSGCRSWLARVSGRSGSTTSARPGPSACGRDGWTIFWPSHCWPHQQRPSLSMMQVPLPQQRRSSLIWNSQVSLRVVSRLFHQWPHGGEAAVHSQALSSVGRRHAQGSQRHHGIVHAVEKIVGDRPAERSAPLSEHHHVLPGQRAHGALQCSAKTAASRLICASLILCNGLIGTRGSSPCTRRRRRGRRA